MSMSNDTTNIKKKKGAIAINRYGFIVILISIVFLTIIVYIGRIMFVEGDMWRELGEKETLKKGRIILPKRGNIYATDGRLLATSEPLYGIYVDFMSEGIKQDTLFKYVDDLSETLAKKYPDRSKAQYKKLFLDGWDLSRGEVAEVERVKENHGTDA